METLTVADEIPDANVVRLWRDPKSGKWCGLLGPADGSGLLLMERDNTGPNGLLVNLACAAQCADWPYDPTARGPAIEPRVK
jgi:hypothetical protein